MTKDAPKSLRVMHFAETIKGGIATYLKIIENQTQGNPLQNIYLIPESQANEISTPENSKRIITHRGSRKISGLPSLIISIRRQISKYSPDIVFAHSTFAGIATALAMIAHKKKPRFIYCPHGWASLRDQAEWKRRFITTIEKKFSTIPSAIINISKNEHEKANALGFSGNMHLIENCAEPSQHPITIKKSVTLEHRPKLRLLYVGRLDRAKGFDVLIEALKLLTQKAEFEFSIDIIGDSVLNDLEVSIPDELDSRINFLGWVSNLEIDRHYANADFLIVPSRNEGFGICVIESFRNATPVIASNRGALPNLVEHEANGLIFELSPLDLCNTIIKASKLNLEHLSLKALDSYIRLYTPQRFTQKLNKLLLSTTQK